MSTLIDTLLLAESDALIAHFLSNMSRLAIEDFALDDLQSQIANWSQDQRHREVALSAAGCQPRGRAMYHRSLVWTGHGARIGRCALGSSPP
eukprot:41784-Prorocentrum_minimum.AAC.4